MLSYVAGRLAAIVALAFGISGLVFLMLRLIPGDPVMALLGTQAANPEVVERLRRQLGLDESMASQYVTWLGNLFRGDFGYSYGQQRPVSELIAANFPATLQLTVCALFLSVLLGLAIGIVAALKRNRAADTLGMGLALALMSIPSFWLGLLLILLFAVTWPIFDVVGGTGFKGVVLPAVTLALGTVGFNARFIRSSVLSAQTQKHVITARAKGLSRATVFLRHVLRNSLLPILTVVGIQVGNLLSGTVVVETVFSRPGLGRLLVDAILSKDYLTVQAVVLIIAVIYAGANFVVDLCYPLLDPRIARR
ncbi:ABC transporter permease [Mangrovicoccus sp. HB161399]|uniref:ABC transporter permease n=1 Tax=Mangrovicoccus sp. HB161399 TaxID=2720392 RepID=UPI0015541155|nr:ABC transporter permease [Mangrovicoccus sp. HB161399]